MPITSTTPEPGIVAVTVDYPPVNAIPSKAWFDLADAVTAAGANSDTRAVILRAEGRGFNAGVDIKEMQRTEGFTALIDANRGCFAAFRAVYECAVPVIAAVNGFCVGGGIGLVGNSDVIVASEDATSACRGGTGRAGRGHAPLAAGAPAPDATAVLYGGHRGRGHLAALRLGARGGVPRSAGRGRFAGGPRHRRQRHPGHPRRQGGAELIDVQRSMRVTGWSKVLPSSSTSPESPTSTATPL